MNIRSRLCSLALGIALLIAILPGPALACAMCFYGKGRNETAYVQATAFMMATVFALIGILVTWLVRSARDREAWDANPPPSGPQDSIDTSEPDMLESGPPPR